MKEPPCKIESISIINKMEGVKRLWILSDVLRSFVILFFV